MLTNLSYHNIALSRKETDVSLYIDNIMLETLSGKLRGEITTAEDGLFIGQKQDSLGGSFKDNQSWNGVIDNLRFFQRALTVNEIKAIDRGVDYAGITGDTAYLLIIGCYS